MTDSAPFAPWTCCAQAPGASPEPAAVQGAWFEAQVPGTVAGALRARDEWNHQNPPEIDAQDWWYRTSFNVTPHSGAPCALWLDGLATLAEVWLNGERLLTTDNMYRSHRLDISQKLKAENELAICFRSVTADLKKRRPRPRWKTNLVNNQQLRWLRTGLLGRIPGWSPPVPAIGPWRAVRLECTPVQLSEVKRTTALEGEDGVVRFQARVASAQRMVSARLRVGGQETTLQIQDDVISGELRMTRPALWWPHTHGAQALHAAAVVIETASGTHEFSLEAVGFRRIEASHEPGFALSVNGERVYCRGACWTTHDIFHPGSSGESLKHELTLARDAGMNMLRIGGTMNYEGDAFYRLCDELGILVWQDFMFANMDYPVEDAAFSTNITAEATQQLARLAQHPCVAVYCGNSEIEQQAAMLGMARELWRNAWFGGQLPALCSQHHPGTVYVPSSPSGGVLPFHTRTGITHFYGIGAYLRSLRELRQADVKFTSECLGFSNVPEPEAIDEIMGGLVPVMHHPRWKQRVPRDTGAGWDFEDVRDHYLREVFGVDPVTLRCFDMPRYLELSRVTSGEMMTRTFAEWRSSHSRNAGALLWFYQDLWPAAGWGIVDSSGAPKAAYYQLKRLWQTRQLTLTDEGLDGLHLHLCNESTEAQEGFLEVKLLREPNVSVACHEIAVKVGPRALETRSVDEILGSFYDVNYAYRFGPPVHHLVAATWYNAAHDVISEAFHFTRARDPEAEPMPAGMLKAEAEALGDGRYRVTLRSERFLHSVRLSAKGYLPADNYFHLMPNRPRSVLFVPRAGGGVLRAYVEALNLTGEIPVELISTSPPSHS